MLSENMNKYNSELELLFTAARLWSDVIIDSAMTREIVSCNTEIVSSNPNIPKSNTGIIQV
jgi:acetyl-CoA carboxylase carboxyltransferase component